MASWKGPVAWGLCGATILATAVQTGLMAFAGGPLLTVDNFEDGGFPIIGTATAAVAVVGALIVSRYPNHRIGWLFSVGAFGTGIGLVTGEYGLGVHRGDIPGPAWTGDLAIWVAALFSAPYALALSAILLLLAPDGRLLSRRWRLALAIPVLGLALHFAGVMSLSPGRVPVDGGADDSVGTLTLVLSAVGQSLILLALPVAGVALVRRVRAAHGEQRQQVRWIAASAVCLAAGTMIAVAASLVYWDERPPWILILPLYLAYASLPICTGIAIMRYRLYDIDVIINRAFVLAVLATFATAGYVAVVVLIGAALGRPAEGQFWPSLLAIAVVALAFQPVRNRVLRWADRLVYGERAVPYEALADFSRRIGVVASPSELMPLFAEAAARGVRARRAWVHVDVPGTSGLSVSWPEDAEGAAGPDDQPAFQMLVRDHGEPMGTLAVTMPPGRALRRDERRLLERFAEQAGLALHNVRLEAELRARVAEATRQSNTLEASRRRLLGARDAERQRVAATISRTVVARLEPLVPDLESGWRAGPDEAADVLRRLDSATGATLDALREVTRGVFPAVLARRGLVPALRAHLAKNGLTDVLRVPEPMEHHRFSPATEAAAYFCCLAALEDMARPVCLELALRHGLLVLAVTGTPGDGTRRHGADGARPDGSPEDQPQSAEESFLADRVEAVGGRVWRDRGPDGVLVLHAELPAAVLSGA